MPAFARTTIGDQEEALVEVLTRPNAIGICQVRYEGQTFARYHSRLRPHNEPARWLLDGAEKFVTRDIKQVQAAREVQAGAAEPIAGWTLEDVALLRELLAGEVAEYQFLLSATPYGPRRTTWKKLLQERAASLRYVNTWLKGERSRLMARKGGLSDAERKDPNALIRRAAEVLAKLAGAYYQATGTPVADEDKAVINALRDYLNHHAPVRREDMPAAHLGRSA